MKENSIEEIKKQISDLQSKVAKIENESKEEKKGKRWRAKTDNNYFYVGDSGDVFTCQEYKFNNYIDNYRYKTRNYFKTEEEAKEYREIMNTYYDLMDLAEELNNGEKINWKDNQQCKYAIFYDYNGDTLDRTHYDTGKDLNQIYCLDEDFLEKAIENIGESRLKKLFKYERN